VKIKSRSRFQVEVDGDVNDEVIKRNDVFQMNELIESYQVILSTELKKNSNFNVTENIYIDIDELNIILSISKYRKVNKDDKIDLEFKKKKKMLDMTTKIIKKRIIIKIYLINLDVMFHYIIKLKLCKIIIGTL